MRKVVTVLFCDLTGSTAIGDRTDPEALRALMNRYYDDRARRARAPWRDGGEVRRRRGDGGVRDPRRDRGRRACAPSASAVELREVVHELGLEARIGVNTGAVVAGEGDTLVTGDAVNVAARLEQAAGAGEILLGDDTLRLVRDAVEAESVELAVKGKADTVPAHRLAALDAGVGRRRAAARRSAGRARARARSVCAPTSRT